MSLFLALCSFAFAGEIQVVTSNPVAIVIDGQMLQYPEGSTAVTATNLSGGTHLIEVKNLFGRPITSATINIQAYEQVRISYAAKTLTEVGRGQLAAQPVVVQPIAVQHAPQQIVVQAVPPQVVIQGGTTYTEQTTVTTNGVPIGGASVGFNVPGASISMNVGGVVPNVQSHTTVTTTTVGGHAPVPVQQVVVDQPISGGDLSALISRLQNASFSSDKLDILRSAAGYHFFLCGQVTRILGTFSFSSDQLSAVQVLRPQILDPQNGYQLGDAFTFSSDKKKVQAMF